jgi:hypothetical protein
MPQHKNHHRQEDADINFEGGSTIAKKGKKEIVSYPAIYRYMPVSPE